MFTLSTRLLFTVSYTTLGLAIASSESTCFSKASACLADCMEPCIKEGDDNYCCVQNKPFLSSSSSSSSCYSTESDCDDHCVTDPVAGLLCLPGEDGDNEGLFCCIDRELDVSPSSPSENDPFVAVDDSLGLLLEGSTVAVATNVLLVGLALLV